MTLESLSEEQLFRLDNAPFDVYTVVAAADFVSDRNEWAAFREAVGNFAGHEDELVKAVMTRLLAELGETPPPHGDIAAALVSLQDVGVVAATLPDGASTYRSVLLEIGQAVAEGSGAQVTRSFGVGGNIPGWQMSSGTSAMERESITQVARALGLA